MNKCPKCGKAFSLDRKVKAIRKMVSIQSRLFPALKEIARKTKDYCNECWKAEMQPAAQGILKEVSTIEPSNEGKV